MYLILKTQMLASGASRTRPVIRLAAGTLLRHLRGVDSRRAFRDLDDFAVYLSIIRLDQAGSGVPMDSPFEPGRVGHRKADRVLTIDVHYNEINMVQERVARDRPGGRDLPVSRDYLDTFAERLETAATRLFAWCDREQAWADQAHYMDHWHAALTALNGGALLRPHEFTSTPKLRDALDACWSLVDAEPLESRRFGPLADAYYLLRDAGWEEAEYQADPSREPTPYGQPCLIANFNANLATSPPPDAASGYSEV